MDAKARDVVIECEAAPETECHHISYLVLIDGLKNSKIYIKLKIKTVSPGLTHTETSGLI